MLCMASRTGAAHVVTTRREYKGRVYTTHLLRRSFREGGKVKNETLGNLSHLPDQVIDLIRRSLKGETFVSAAEAFDRVASLAHGHVQAVRTAMNRLGFERLIGSRPSRERDLVCAMVAARIIAPHTKLATTRWWQSTTLAEQFGVADADENDLYQAMDWLLQRQGAIERTLASRHLQPGALVLYDLSSSYFEGSTCPLPKLGHNRDGKKGKLQVNNGLLTDRRGCPVAISVFEGNMADSKTLSSQINKMRGDFCIERFVLVGDRGMISQKAIEQELPALEGLSWITALKSRQIRTLVEGGGLQLGLFDKRNLFEFTHPAYPGERLIACRNAELLKLRAHKRRSLIACADTSGCACWPTMWSGICARPGARCCSPTRIRWPNSPGIPLRPPGVQRPPNARPRPICSRTARRRTATRRCCRSSRRSCATVARPRVRAHHSIC